MVHQCNSAEDFKTRVASGTTIVDFTAQWCGPCQAIAPHFMELSEKFTTIQFIKVDVDELDDLAVEFGVSAMPTFMVFKNGEMVEQMVGASKEKLTELVEKYKA